MRATDQTFRHLDWLYTHVETLDLAMLLPPASRTATASDRKSRRMLHPQRTGWRAHLTREALEHQLGYARHLNATGADVYIRPHRYAPAPLLLLDDLKPDVALRIARKYAAIVLETSRDNAQVSIVTTQPLDESQRLTAQRTLASRMGADPGSVSGEHLSRLAGFRNQKASHPDHPWINVMASTDCARLDAAPLVADPALPLLPARGGGRDCGSSGQGNHAKPMCRPAVSHSAAARRRPLAGEKANQSAVDYGRACHRLEHGEDPAAVINWLTDDAYARGKRDAVAVCREYAQRTVDAARRRMAFHH